MDQRTLLEKILWKSIGEPLYYCEECLRVVRVDYAEGVPVIKKACNHANARVIAPRKSVMSGKGYAGLSVKNKIKSTIQQTAAKITGRNV